MNGSTTSIISNQRSKTTDESTTPIINTNKPIAVRCPIDFHAPDVPAHGGLNRITRHPSLWILSFIGLGFSLSSPFASQFVFYSFPTAFALIGGAHQGKKVCVILYA
jgi:hypothetical protein